MRAQLQLVDAQAEEMSQALGLSACPIAGEVFDDLSTLTFSPLNRPGASLVLRAGLVSLNRMVQQNNSSDAILKRACDILQRAFNFQRVVAYSALMQSQWFSLRAIAGKICNVTARTHCLQRVVQESVVQEGVVRETLVKNVNLYLRSRDDAALGQSWEHWFSLFPDAKSFFVLPIVGGDRLLGLIYADYPRSNEQGWTSDELDAVEATKRVIYAALEKECS